MMRPLMRRNAPLVAALCLVLAAPGRAQDMDGDEEIANRLAAMLRAGRSVVSAHQAEINDPALADKGFTGDAFTAEAGEVFAETTGTAPEAMDLSERDRRLLDAITQSMQEVVDEHQEEINQPGVGFKGFIPAVFSRLANEKFAVLAAPDARMRVTAPPDLVRNRKARPDDWERQVIDQRFLNPDWPEGAPYSEVVPVDGRDAFRIMLPEYYRPTCLECHGGPKGEVDVTGYPKEGADAGDLGGIISITIFR